MDLYERNMGKGSLKMEHIKLTSFSKMRVDLAAQVPSPVLHTAKSFLLILFVGFE